MIKIDDTIIQHLLHIGVSITFNYVFCSNYYCVTNRFFFLYISNVIFIVIVPSINFSKHYAILVPLYAEVSSKNNLLFSANY